MKVLVLPSWYPPDGGWFFREQAEHLHRFGHEVSVLYVKPISYRKNIKKLFKKRFCSFIENEIFVSKFEFLYIPRIYCLVPIFQSFATLKCFKKHIKKYGVPDLIHVHSSVWSGFSALLIKLIFKIPYVITEHRGRFTLQNKYAASEIKYWFPLYLNSVFKHASAVILVGSLLERGLARYRGIGNLWEIIPNGVDTEIFKFNHVFVDKNFKFICVANLVKEKNHTILFHAFKILVTKYSNIRLLIVGDGVEKNNLKMLCHNLQLNDFVEFSGAVSKKKVVFYLNQSNAFVLPSEFEAQGVAYIEAMSCGLPVISTFGSPPELHPDYAGIKINSDNLPELVNAMTRLYESYAGYDRERIRNFAVVSYDYKHIARKIDAIYTKVLKKCKTIQ